MSVTVNDTIPQCVADLKLNCLSENGFRIDFTPGFDGGYEQKFRLYYTELSNDQDQREIEWFKTNEFHDTTLALTDLNLFTQYRIMVSPSNQLGSVNCTAVNKHSKNN